MPKKSSKPWVYKKVDLHVWTKSYSSTKVSSFVWGVSNIPTRLLPWYPCFGWPSILISAPSPLPPCLHE